MRKFLGRGLLVFSLVVAATGGGLLSNPVRAADTDPTYTVTSGGAAASNLVANAVVASKIKAPVATSVGTSTLETTWTHGTANVSYNSIVAPDGFSLEYRLSDGTWTSTRPAQASSVSGVRASNLFTSQGYNLGTDTQTVKADASGTLVTGAAEFQGSSGGDGWDVFFNHPNYDKVLNVWHHNSSAIKIDCHFKESGAACWSGLNGANQTFFNVAGYQASNKSGGGSYNGKIYLFTRTQSAVGGVYPTGFYCVDVSGASPVACGTPFISLLSSTASGYDTLSEVVQIGSKLYAFDMGLDKMVCFDANAGAACANQPYDVGVTGSSTFYTFLEASGSKVFVSGDSNNKLGCVDATTDSVCGAPFPITATYGSTPIGADGSGGICFLDSTDRNGANAGDGNCFDAAGVQSDRPAALSTLLTSAAIGGLHANYGSVATSGTKLYWGANSGTNASGQTRKKAYCFDFSTGAACVGFANNPVLSNSLYATVAEPSNPNCIWGNGDDGKITQFNGTTGVGGCALPIPEVSFPSVQAAPRLSCTAADSLKSWIDFKLVIPGAINVADLEFDLRDSSGSLINSWSNIDLGNVGADSRFTVNGQNVTIDLSTLTVAATGQTPEFRFITSQGTTDANAELIEAEVRFTSAPPELCMNLTVQAPCPAGVGQAPAATVQPANLGLTAKSTRIVGGVTTTDTLNGTTSMAAKAGCLGTVKGIVVDQDSLPVAGAVVGLYDGNTKIAEGLTDSTGEAVFPNIYPFAASALKLRFSAGGGYAPIDDADAPLSQLTAGNTVSATRSYRVSYIENPPTTARGTTTPVTTAPPTSPPPTPVSTAPNSLPELEEGDGAATEGGKKIDVTVREISTGKWEMTGPGFRWEMEIPAADTPGSAQGIVTLIRNRDVIVRGFGFLPDSWVDVWVFSTPIYLGRVKVKSDGTFEGPLLVPANIEVGGHTVQANGTSFDRVGRTLNLGVQVLDTRPKLPITGGGASGGLSIGLGLVLMGLFTVLIGRRCRLISKS